MIRIHESDTTAFVDHPVAELGSLMPAPALRPGQVLGGRFRLGRALGRGGMGEVWEVFDTALGDARLALKTIRAEAAGQPKAMARFKQELRLLRQITHAHVCRVFDFVPAAESEPAFFTMELLEGETLAARLRRDGALTPAHAAEVLDQVLAGLAAAHAAGVIHRDLKPGNIMLNAGRAVLMDFGIARIDAPSSSNATSLTQGEAIGTPAYMSPEQLQGGAVTHATDIYSFGLVAYEALTGAQPFATPTPLAGVARKLSTPARAVVETGPALPGVWPGIIERCLALDPAERFATAADVRAAMGGPPLRRAPARAAQRFRRWALAAALVLMVTALAGYAWWRRQQPPGDAQRLYTAGVQALAENAPARASRLFEAALEKHAGWALAHARRAQALMALDQLDLARESQLRALEARERTWLPSAYDRRSFDAIRAWITRDFAAAAERFGAAVSAASADQRLPALLDQAAAQEALEKPRVAEETYRRALALDAQHPTVHLRLGMLAARRQDIKAAMAAFDRAQRGYEMLSNAEAIAETWIRRGEAWLRVGRFREAAEAMEAGRRYAEANRLAAHQVRALFGASSAAVGAGEMETARRQADRALALARAENQEAQVVFALNDLANAHLTQMKLEETAALAGQALRLAERYRQPVSAARARLLLMNTRLYGKSTPAELDEARAWGRQALAFYEGAGYRQRAVDVRLMLGRLESRSENFASATAVLTPAAEAARALGNPQSEGLASLALAFAAYGAGHWPDAVAHASRAVEAYRRLGAPGNLAYGLLGLAENRAALGQTDTEPLLEEASRVAAKNPRVAAQVALARAARAGRVGDAAAARRWFAEASAFGDDESPEWAVRVAALRATLEPTRRAESCNMIERMEREGLPVDARVTGALACGGAALERLATTARAAGNHAVAWRALEALRAGHPDSAAEAAAVAREWGAASAREFADRWKLKGL